jgi:ABC-2 type transport system permease protein
MSKGTTMRKILVVAAREYKTAIRTKSFLVSILLVPVLWVVSGGVQVLMKKQANTQDKHFAVIDRTPGGKIFGLLQAAAEKRNEKDIYDPDTGKQVKPRFFLENIPPSDDTAEAIDQQRLALSQEVEHDKYWGFVEIGSKALDLVSPGQTASPKKDERRALRYQTNHPTYEDFPRWIEQKIFFALGSLRGGMSPDELEKLASQPSITLRREGLSQVDAHGKVVDPKVINQIARFLVPAALVALMFVIVMLASTPAMHGVVEEKMQRIAEVLLGSLRPFDLMMGKLLGVMGVSLTVAAVYLTGAYAAAHYYEFTEFLPVPILIWFVVFQTLAVLMFGSLFLAIGAAATDLKETQTLVMPVMLVACIPMMILGAALDDPNGGLVVAMSFFPPSTPMLMMARVAIPPGPQWWEPFLGALLVLAVTVGCVYAAGRIFRVGILLQGKGPRFGQLIQWVFRG